MARRIVRLLSEDPMPQWRLRQRIGGHVELEVFNRAVIGLLRSGEIQERHVKNAETNRERKVLVPVKSD